MELRHLRDFVAVAEEQNITRAATRLHVSQPPLSRQVRDLEQELGVALLERGAKSVRLTAAGRLFLDEARAVLRRADEAVRSVQALGGAAEAGTARGIRPDPDRGNPGPASAGLRGVVAGRLRASPRHDGNGDDGGPQGGGARGGAGRPAAPHGPGRARVPRVRQYRMGVLVARDHPLCRRRKLPVSAVRQEPLVVYRRADYPDYHETLEAALGTAPETWRIVEECDGALSLLSAVEVGRGIAVVPEPASIVAGQRAVFIPFTPSPALLEVGVCTRSDAPADARSLLEAARAVAG